MGDGVQTPVNTGFSALPRQLQQPASKLTAAASAICLVDFTHIPDGLNASELEKYLREHGAGRIRNPSRGTHSDITT